MGDKGMELKLYNGPEDLINFKIHVSPDDGMYKRGCFVFDFKVPKTYPHDPPKVQCQTTLSTRRPRRCCQTTRGALQTRSSRRSRAGPCRWLASGSLSPSSNRSRRCTSYYV